MGVLMLVVAGGAIGYLASLVLCEGEHALLNVIVGMFGALLATLLLIPYFGMPAVFGGDISIASFFSALMGSVVGAGVLNLSLIRNEELA